ncbi:molybdopterin-dependent oxidoreductase, partial [Kineococcus glutinatus]|uniref:molybdopterin-dependent oxidoreductase n=1 Tax=Kineococcus glutinatus TaxID=1070872 RepID=UPI0031EA9086
GGRVLAGTGRGSGPAPALPAAAVPAPPLPEGADPPVDGLTPYATPVGDFYRIDTAFWNVPDVSAQQWRLRISGLVGREVEVSYADVLAMPLVERWITLTCVSNEVGGPYAGTARWLGVPLADLLRRAAPTAAADMLLARSVDGFTTSTPLADVLDGRDALLAVGMDGAALPREHGFPARMVVPGLYGYVSACKWVTEIEVTRFDRAAAYWTERGWAERAPVRTASRIDVPRSEATVRAGTAVAVAGVAWAQRRGIRRVEVRLDDGPWQEAQVLPAVSADTWVQWLWRWPRAAAGEHVLQVRATDGTGAVQDAEQRPPEPDGATGYHAITVTAA